MRIIASIIVGLLLTAADVSAQTARSTSANVSPPSGAPAADADARISRALASLNREPAIGLVQTRALRYFALHPDKIAELRAQASDRHAAPELRVAYTAQINDTNEDYVGSGAALAGQRASNDTSGLGHIATAELTWDFPKFVFDPSVLDTYDLTHAQIDLIKDITRIYFERREKLVTLLVEPPTEVQALARLRAEIDERTALLDAMTGGWFGRALTALHR